MARHISVFLLSFLSFLISSARSLPEVSPSDSSVSIAHWGYEGNVQMGRILALDQYQRSYMRGRGDWSAELRLNHVSLPSDSDAFAADYGYPTFSLVGRFSCNERGTMRRGEDYPRWDGLPEDFYELAPYDSRLGNSFAVFGSFSVPLVRSRRCEVAVCGNLGVAYAAKKYDKVRSVDNDMIGAHVLFFAGAAASATLRVAEDWGVKMGLDYWHISNGSTRQPNRSQNVLGPTLGVVYYPYYGTVVRERGSFRPVAFRGGWYVNVKAGVGMQTRIEDWERAQYQLLKTDPDWRTEHFRLYSVASLQADAMWRYARIGAVGAGVETDYYSASSHIRRLDEQRMRDRQHSPWSVALAVKHTFFYGNVSVALGAGTYLFRQMGDFAERHDPPMFNRIGVHYAFPRAGGLSAGIEVKAHLAKADFTELVISYPIPVGRRGGK